MGLVIEVLALGHANVTITFPQDFTCTLDSGLLQHPTVPILGIRHALQEGGDKIGNGDVMNV